MKSCIVKRSFTLKLLFPSLTVLAVTFIVGIASLALLPSLFIPVLAVGIIIAVLLVPGSIFTEYEYNIEADIFSVALIKNKSSRKELFSCDIEHLVTIEPYANQKINGVKLDCSEKINTPYIAVFNVEGNISSVLFSPDDAFVRELFLLSPSKVKRSII